MSDLVGFSFTTDEDFRNAWSVFNEDSRGASEYMGSPKKNTMTIYRKNADWFGKKLKRKGISFTPEQVRTMADLTPEEAVALRSKQGQPSRPELADRRQVLADLQKYYGVPPVS